MLNRSSRSHRIPTVSSIDGKETPDLLFRVIQLILAMTVASSIICITLVVLLTLRLRNVQAAQINRPLITDTLALAATNQYTPVLTIIKKDDPVAGGVGDTVTYEFEVEHSIGSNPSDLSPVTNIVVIDSIAGIASLDLGNSVGAGDGILDGTDRWIYTATYTIQATDPDPLTNTAVVTGTDLDGDLITDTSNVHQLDIEFDPFLAISKNGPDTAKIGETIVFSYTLTNDSINGDGSSINIISLDDNPIGPVTNRTIITGDNDAELEIGEIWIYTATYTVPTTDTDILVNTATVQAEDRDGDPVITTTIATHSTNLLPALNIIKTGPDAANVGNPLVFTFAITNDIAKGDGTPINLTSASVSDSIAGLATYVQGDNNANGLLEKTETWTYTAAYTVVPTDPHTMPNIVTVTGADLVDNAIITATDIHTTIVEHKPVLKITKQSTPPVTAMVGQTVTYEFEVDHSLIPSDRSDLSPVTIISVTDSLAGMASLDLGHSTGAGDGMLDGGDKWVYTVTYIVKPTDPDPLTNTVVVTAIDLDGDVITSSIERPHELDIEFKPKLAVTKTGPDVARIGETIVYTFVVTNNGPPSGGDGSRIANVSVIDSLIGPIINPQKENGNLDSRLEMGEKWIYTATYTVPATTSFDLPNTVNVYSQDRDHDSVPIATAAHMVNLLPVLTIDKEGPESATISETVTFTFTVSHADVPTISNGEPVTNVIVNDALGEDETYIEGDTNGNDELDPGEHWVYTVSHKINAPLISSFFVTGEDQAGYPIEATLPYSIEIPEFIYFPIIFKNHLVCSTHLVDHFNDPNSGWLTGNFDNDKAIYSYVPMPSEYNIELRDDVIGHSMSPFGSFGQYIVKVRAKWADTSLGAWYGIIFGINGATNQRVTGILQTGHLYRFIVDTRGNNPKFTLELLDGDQFPLQWHPVTSGWSNHPAIKKGTELNTLEVRCYGSRAEIYVNDYSNPLFNDNLPFTCSGQIGITTRFDLSQNSTNARFDDFEACGQQSSNPVMSSGNGVEISVPTE